MVNSKWESVAICIKQLKTFAGMILTHNEDLFLSASEFKLPIESKAFKQLEMLKLCKILTKQVCIFTNQVWKKRLSLYLFINAPINAETSSYSSLLLHNSFLQILSNVKIYEWEILFQLYALKFKKQKNKHLILWSCQMNTEYERKMSHEQWVERKES